MKTCSKCKQDLPLTKFNKKANRKDGLQTFCRECNRVRSRQYYAENRDKHIVNTGVHRDKYRLQAQEYVMSILSESCCADCRTKNIIVLEFDHVAEKENNISSMVASACSISRIKKEIEKCEIVCRNCHALRTHQRGNTFRWKFAVERGMC